MTVVDFESLRTPQRSWTYSAKEKTLQDELRTFHVGDRVVIYSDTPPDLTSLAPARVEEMATCERIVALLLSVAVLISLLAVLLGRQVSMLLIGLDGRYSNSKFQMFVWFGVVITTYVATNFLRWYASGCSSEFIGGVDFPQNLLLLSGLSALTFGGAKAITVSQVQGAEANASAQPGATKEDVTKAIDKAKPKLKPDEVASFFKNLACDDQGNPDLGDVQMVVVTILAVLVYFCQVWHFLGTIQLLKNVTIPDVDTTILATFGLGQGAYLAKKATG